MAAFVRIDLPDRSPDFQRIALEPGVPLLDRGQTTSRLLRVWLGRFVAEPEWMDLQSVQFYLNDDQGRRITITGIRPATAEDLAGRLKYEVNALRTKLDQIEPRGRTEQTVVNLLRERFEKLATTNSDSGLFCYRDANGKWRLVWCWGYQRGDSKFESSAICVNDECRRLYLLRGQDDPKCSKCGTPMPRFRFPWKKVGYAAVLMLLLVAVAGWRYWSTLPRSAIEGHVIWGGFNIPIVKAQVRIDSLNVVALTDEQGRFHLDHLPAGELDLTVTADGFPVVSTKQTVEQSQRSTMSIQLTANGILAGRVIDSVSRQPCPGAKLVLGETTQTAESDDEGRFRFTGCRRGLNKLEISLPGYPSVNHEVDVTSDQQGPIDFEVTGNAILIGQVVSAIQDKPMPGVVVRLNASGQTAKTDAEGWYSFKQAPHGVQEVIVELDGFATQRVEKELVAGQERQASFKMAGAAKLSGQVVRAIDLSPLPKIDVTIAGTKLAAKTDADGAFRFQGVIAGKATIEVAAPGFAMERVEKELSSSDETVLQIKLAGDAAISGQIIDELTKQPVADAEIRLAGTPHVTKSGEDGRYRLDAIPSLSAKLEIRSEGYIGKTVDARPQAREVTNVPVVVQGNAAISGTVIERWSESPIEGAKVTLAGTNVVVNTTAEGSFDLKGLRSGGKREIHVTAEGLVRQMETLELKPGAAEPLKIVMTGAASLTGHVISALDDSPIAAARVKLVGTQHQVTTDAKGQFQLNQLPAGRIGVEVSADRYETRRIVQQVSTDSKPVSISLGGTASLTGEIVDGVTGLPLADVEINIANTALKTRSTKEGTYELKGAFAGSAKVVVSADGYPRQTETVEFVNNQESKKDFKLTGTSSVSGEVYDDLGKPVANAIVSLAETEHKVATGARGDFQLGKLRAGATRFQVKAPMFAVKNASADLKADEVKSLGRLMLVSSLALRGHVADAVTGARLKGATVTIASLNLKKTTDAEGRFQFDGIPARSHTVTIEANDHVAESLGINPSLEDESEQFWLAPVPKQDEVLIVLGWRGKSQLLNGHLYRAENSKAEAHTFVGSPQGDNLTVSTPQNTSRNPELFRIHPLKPGRYEMAVAVTQDPSANSDPNLVLKLLSQSEATVKVYRHGQTAPAIYRAGKNKNATVWQPFGIEITPAGMIVDHVYKAEHYRTSLPPEIRSK